MTTIKQADLIQSVADALQFISYYHPLDYIRALGRAYERDLVAKAIRSARVVAFDDLGMEAIHEFEVKDMPVTVAVDANGTSVHNTGPAEWSKKIIELKLPVTAA